MFTARSSRKPPGCLMMVLSLRPMNRLMVVMALGVLAGCSAQSSNLNGNEVGKPLEMGRTGCERALKQQLRDPNSLEEAKYVITAASPTNWTAQMDFRSRNGFGGMVPGTATCTFNGTVYRAVIKN